MDSAGEGRRREAGRRGSSGSAQGPSDRDRPLPHRPAVGSREQRGEAGRDDGARGTARDRARATIAARRRGRRRATARHETAHGQPAATSRDRASRCREPATRSARPGPGHGSRCGRQIPHRARLRRTRGPRGRPTPEAPPASSRRAASRRAWLSRVRDDGDERRRRPIPDELVSRRSEPARPGERGGSSLAQHVHDREVVALLRAPGNVQGGRADPGH